MSTEAAGWTLCPECDHLVNLPRLEAEGSLCCPHCDARLRRQVAQPEQQVLATGFAALVALGLSLPFPFISFAANGLSHTTDLAGTLVELGKYGEGILAAFLFTTVVLVPMVFILALMTIHADLHRDWPRIWRQRLGHGLVHLKPWLMSEVFFIGVLVSAVKIMDIADLGFGLSFYAFTGFTLLLVRVLYLLDVEELWDRLIPEFQSPPRPADPTLVRGHEAGLGTCHHCHATVQGHDCSRCGATVHARQPDSLQRVLALLFVSVLLYIPANTQPVMITDFLGDVGNSTILGGVMLLWDYGSYPVALIIFIASVMVPSGKILALAWLCWQVKRGEQPRRGNKVYRVVEFIGRWSMIDVFVVSVLVALIQQAPIMAFYPGGAALYFAGVVVITMLASEQFDPRLLWDRKEVAP